MNAYASFLAHEALFLANQRTQELITEADANRIAVHARKSRPGRIAAAIASVKAALQVPETSRGSTVVPQLRDYPYRS